MIEQLRKKLDWLGEDYSEKNAVFKVRVIPFFCSIRIKKDHKREGGLTFYSSQLLEIMLVVLFILFGIAIFDPAKGLTYGPVHLVFAILLALNLVIRQVATEGLKTRLLLAEQQLAASSACPDNKQVTDVPGS